MDKEYNKCEGCVTYESFQYSKCADTKIELCPCQNCLVKVMCRWACDYLRLHWDNNTKCPHK